MINVPISAVPNQSFSVLLDGSLYELVIKQVDDYAAVIDITRDAEVLLLGQRLTPGTPIFPYGYLQQGNFVFLTLNDELPDYNKFGISQRLIYITQAEIEALNAE